MHAMHLIYAMTFFCEDNNFHICGHAVFEALKLGAFTVLCELTVRLALLKSNSGVWFYSSNAFAKSTALEGSIH